MFHKANKKGLKPENVISTQVKILILNATCNGFGDIIFALKLFRYLKEWYGDLIDVKIATNNRKRFLGLIGEDEGDNVIRLQLKSKNKEVKGGSGRRSGRVGGGGGQSLDARGAAAVKAEPPPLGRRLDELRRHVELERKDPVEGGRAVSPGVEGRDGEGRERGARGHARREQGGDRGSSLFVRESERHGRPG